MKKLCPSCRRLHGTGELGPRLGIIKRSWCKPCAESRQSDEKRRHMAETSVFDMIDYLLDCELPLYVEEYMINLNDKLKRRHHLTPPQRDLIRRTYAKVKRIPR